MGRLPELGKLTHTMMMASSIERGAASRGITVAVASTAAASCAAAAIVTTSQRRQDDRTPDFSAFVLAAEGERVVLCAQLPSRPDKEVGYSDAEAHVQHRPERQHRPLLHVPVALNGEAHARED